MKLLHAVTAIALLAATSSNASSTAMIPPWIYHVRVLQNTIGAGSCVKVDLPAPGTRTIPIQACSDEVGKALLFVLAEMKDIRVTDEKGTEIPPYSDKDIAQTLDFVVEQLGIALKGNPLVVKIHKVGMLHLNRISLELTPKIAQFYTDDISDPFRHSTFLVQDLFTRAISPKFFDKFSFSTTTSKIH